MNASVPYQHLCSPDLLTAAELDALLDAAALLKQAAQRGWVPLRDRHLALLCSHCTDTRAAFEQAVTALGGAASLLDADEWRARAGDAVPEAALFLGRLYDAIDCCDLPNTLVEQIEAHSGVPVFNGLAGAAHPLRLVGEFLTMRELAGKPLRGLRLDVTPHPGSEAHSASLRLARLAGMHVGAAPATGAAPDFVLDPAPPMAAPCLTMPHASAAQQAEIGRRSAENRRCALQAALVCALR